VGLKSKVFAVIPAQAGIHFAFHHTKKIKMDSRLRGNDVRFGAFAFATILVTPPRRRCKYLSRRQGVDVRRTPAMESLLRSSSNIASQRLSTVTAPSSALLCQLESGLDGPHKVCARRLTQITARRGRKAFS